MGCPGPLSRRTDLFLRTCDDEVSYFKNECALGTIGQAPTKSDMSFLYNHLFETTFDTQRFISRYFCADCARRARSFNILVQTRVVSVLCVQVGCQRIGLDQLVQLFPSCLGALSVRRLCAMCR